MTGALHDDLYPFADVAWALRRMAFSGHPKGRAAVQAVADDLTLAENAAGWREALNERGRREPWTNTARQVAEAKAGREAGWPDDPALQAQHGGPDGGATTPDAAQEPEP